MILKPPKGAMLNRGHPYARGLKAHWLMNENGGDIVNDLSGNLQPGVFQNAKPTWRAGRAGPCLYFAGSEYTPEYIKGGAITLTAPYTIVASVKRNGIGVAEAIMSLGDDSDYYPHFIINDNNKLLFQTSANLYRYSDATLAADRWYNVAVSVGNTDDSLTFHTYIDGLLNDGAYYAFSTGVEPVGWRIGASLTNLNRFRGCICCVMLYSRVLSAIEILNLYRSNFCMFEVDL